VCVCVCVCVRVCVCVCLRTAAYVRFILRATLFKDINEDLRAFLQSLDYFDDVYTSGAVCTFY